MGTRTGHSSYQIFCSFSNYWVSNKHSTNPHIYHHVIIGRLETRCPQHDTGCARKTEDTSAHMLLRPLSWALHQNGEQQLRDRRTLHFMKLSALVRQEGRRTTWAEAKLGSHSGLLKATQGPLHQSQHPAPSTQPRASMRCIQHLVLCALIFQNALAFSPPFPQGSLFNFTLDSVPFMFSKNPPCSVSRY